MHSAFDINQIKENTTKVIDGPLREIIKTGKGTIVINWTNFSANEKAIYKSLIDDLPTLNGLSIPATVKVVGLLEESSEVNDVFLSRCDELRLPEKIQLPQDIYLSKPWYVKQDLKMSSDEKIQIINLYHDIDWKQALVETIKVDQDDLLSIEGSLINCMRNGLRLIIKNAPWDNQEFKLFWHNFTTENVILVNGEKIIPAKGFKVVFKEEALVSNLNFTYDKMLDKKSRKIYLTEDNFNQLFNTQHITAQGKVLSLAPGFLHDFKQGDQFVINNPMTIDQAQKVFDTINLIKKTKPQMPGVNFCIQVLPRESVKADAKNRNYHIESNDPDFYLKSIKDCKPENIFYTTIESNWSDFFEDILLVKVNNKIRAERKEQSLWIKLKKGEKVVLSGDLTSEEYAAIKTLFMDPPHLYINGIREDNIKGTLIWISKPQLAYNANEIPTVKIDVNSMNYVNTLKEEQKQVNEKIITNLNYFLTCAKNIKPNNTPDLSMVSYDKYKLLYQYAESKSSQENPIKAIFNYYYKKGTAEYAYLNVLAKFYLSHSDVEYVRKDKLFKLINNINYDQFKTIFWQVVNCFSAKAFRKLMRDTGIMPGLVFPLPNNEQMKKVWDCVTQIQSRKLNIKPINPNRFKKQQERLAAILKDNGKRLTFLLGPAGTGKTFTAKRVVKKENLFVGETKIQAWLDAKSEQAMLLLDEANLEASGKWEFLRGLSNNPPSVTYKNKTTVLGPQHRVIVTGNPYDYTGRNWHTVFWEKAHVIWFAPFQPHFIKEKIKEFMQVNDSAEFQKNANLICHAYTYLCNHAKCIVEITLRDIENICARFLSAKYAMNRVIFDEMSGVLANDEGRAQFKAYLEKISGPVPEHKFSNKPNELFILDDFYDAWVALQDDLKMREERVKSGSNVLPGRSGSNKLATLLEGASGVGKSTLLEAALKQLGFDLHAADTQKRYYKITAGSANVEEILLKAFHDGSIVILDELNLKKEIEILLNQLLSGSDPSGDSAKKSGFTLLASQNPSHYAGTKLMSEALGSRFHKINMKKLSPKSIEKYAESEGHPEPKAVPTAYQDMQQKYSFVNARHMFHAVKKYKKQDMVVGQVKDFKRK